MANFLGTLKEFNPDTMDWRVYKKRLEQFFIANGIEDNSKKSAILLNSLSENAYELLLNLFIPDEPEGKAFAILQAKLDEHFKAVRSVFAERHKFYEIKMGIEETPAVWATKVRSAARYCEFGAFLTTAMRDKFVVGYEAGRIKEKLFLENAGTATFEGVLAIAQNLEAAGNLHRDIARAEAIAVKPEPAEPVYRLRSSGRSTPTTLADNRTAGSSRSPRETQTCSVCGKRNHVKFECRYKNFRCRKCKQVGHLGKMCRAVMGNHINTVCEEDEDSDEDYIYNLQIKEGLEPWWVQVRINTVDLKMLVDTGASISAISEEMWRKYFYNMKLIPARIFFKTYTGPREKPLGYFKATVKYENKSCTLVLYVIAGGGPPLLGRDWLKACKLGLREINLITPENEGVRKICNKFKQVFEEGLGTLKGVKAGLTLKEGAAPKFCKPRPLAFSLKNKIEQELETLLHKGIIEPVSHSNWATPIVPVLKEDGSVRICGDYKTTVNPCLEIDKYPLPRVDELFCSLRNGEEFTKIDLSNAYLQVPLDETSQRLTTINTHRGLFQYKRLCFGIASAPAIFQKIMEGLFRDLEGVICFLDDILITGKNRSEHLGRLAEVLRRLEEAGLRVRKNKCKFLKENVHYLGHVINKKGIHTSPIKTEAIIKAPTPTKVSELKSFLGMVTYYQKFIPNMSSLLKPLYELTQKNFRWKWTNECKNAFEEVKKELVSPRVLAHFDPDIPIKLTVDASPYGLGAVLSHIYENGDVKPIAFASRILNKTQQNYAQIDREALAVVFGVQKFHQYLFGMEFILETDNKPLLAIFGTKQGLPTLCASRLQRYAYFLSGYRFKIKHIKGGDNNADALSRLPLTGSEAKDKFNNLTYLHFIEEAEIPISIETIKKESMNDTTVKRVISYTMQGWPKETVNTALTPYKRRKLELTVENGILMWGHRVVIPQELRKRFLDEFHSVHFGITKMKSLARAYCWWPTMDEDIERVAQSCETCNKIKNSPPSAQLIPWPWPKYPFERVHIDFLGPIFGKNFLVLTDAHSKWLEAWYMKSTTSSAVIEKLRQCFSRFGLPTKIVSDNGPQFCSQEFQIFLKRNGIAQITSAPYFPATNGAAENSVNTIKKFLMKENNMNKLLNVERSLCKFLFMYRTTPHCSTGVAPAQLMFNRNIKTKFDLIKYNFEPKRTDNAGVAQNVKKAQRAQQSNYKGNRNSHFGLGELVFVKDYRVNNPCWTKAKIIKILGTRNYSVKVLGENYVWKRHVNQMRNCKDDESIIEDVKIGEEANSKIDNKEICVDDKKNSAGDKGEENVEGKVGGADEGMGSSDNVSTPNTPETVSTTRDLPRACKQGVRYFIKGGRL